MGSIGEAARGLAGFVAAAIEQPSADQRTALADLLRTRVHDPVAEATAEGDELPEQELRELADTVAAVVPVAAEDPLEPRVRVFIRLLRGGAIAAAWTLAGDNAAGTVAQQGGFSTSSGAVRSSVRLPLFTMVEGDRCYAWLPGFRDPRWGIPDSVYDVSADVGARNCLEEARIDDGRLLLAGWAHLTVLSTGPDDSVAVLLESPDGAWLDYPARRVRRPDLVKGTGEDLTRLAWAGFSAEVDLAALAAASGAWQVSLAVGHGELTRVVPLGVTRGPLARAELVASPAEAAGHVVRLGADRTGALTVRSQPLGTSARIVPRRLRTAARGLIGRR